MTRLFPSCCTVALLLWGRSALAGPSTAPPPVSATPPAGQTSTSTVAAQYGPTYAGIRLERAAELGLGKPTPMKQADIWKASCPGGFVVVSWSPDAVTADADLHWQASLLRSGLPSVTIAGADAALGDEGLIVARRANVVTLTRCDAAIATAERLIAAIEPEVVGGPALVRVAGGDTQAADAGTQAADPLVDVREARDKFGRRIAR
jgi:hypothetical protein